MLNFLKNLFGGGGASAAYSNLSPNDFGLKIAQHTEGVLLDLGFDLDTIKELNERGIIKII